MGGKGAHKLLQIAINRLNEKAITVDGILGDQTMAAANTTDGILLREQLRQCARHRYIEILAAHPHMEVFRNGWLRRAAW
jgi:lysozyme family protein